MVDYNYYRGVYGGVSVSDVIQFNRLSREALSMLNYYTFNRCSLVTDEKLIDKIKLTICYLVDKLYKDERSENIASSSIEGVSVSYFKPGEVNSSSAYEIIRRELLGTGLTTNGFNNRGRY